MLIATLPALHRTDLLEKIISDPAVSAVRYNTGAVLSYSVRETLQLLKNMTEFYSKSLWIDLKGRQLRIMHWAVPDYAKIVLNHKIEVEGSARVYFRGDQFSELKLARGNVIYVDPPPRTAVGEGQSINILGENVRILGYLTGRDKEFLRVSGDLGITDFCLSFVEGWEDIREAEKVFAENPNVKPDVHAKFYLKIESPKGFDFAAGLSSDAVKRYRIIAARDDLLVTLGGNKPAMLSMLENFVTINPAAIVASRLFSGLENGGAVTFADYTDLELMRRFGYKNFMLSDGICGRHFSEAIKAWKEFFTHTKSAERRL